MTDERLQRWLEAVEEPLVPDAAFRDSLRRDLHAELGFERARRGGLWTATGSRPRLRRQPRRSIRQLLLVAALVVVAAVGVIGVAGRLLTAPVPTPAPSLLSIVRDRGELRIAVRPDHPQAAIGGQAAAGFDVDVATELARRVGLRAAIVIEDPARIVDPRGARDWDVALPSVAVWSVDGPFLTSQPYYYWRHRVVVAASSTATTVTDVAAAPICAVAGDVGELWLHGRLPAATSSPISSSIVTKASDKECFDALTSGEVVAVVTARMSDAELDVRDDIRVIGGSPAEPRAAILVRPSAGSPDPVGLLDELNRAFAAMQADGTLARLSATRFGGADLSTP